MERVSEISDKQWKLSNLINRELKKKKDENNEHSLRHL